MSNSVLYQRGYPQITERYLRKYFDIQSDNEIKINISGKFEYTICTLKELFNPKYGLYERFKLVLNKTKEAHGGFPAGNNYQNVLFLLAALSERVDDLTLEEWQRRVYNKRGIL